jgi:hypothetical protein
VADEQPGACSGRQPAHKIEQMARGRAIHRRLEDDGRLGAKFGLHKLPCLTGSQGGGAHDVIGSAARLPEPASSLRRVAAATWGKRPIVIRNVLGPRRLGMPQQDQRPRRPCLHGRSLPRRAVTAGRGAGPPAQRRRRRCRLSYRPMAGCEACAVLLGTLGEQNGGGTRRKRGAAANGPCLTTAGGSGAIN